MKTKASHRAERIQSPTKQITEIYFKDILDTWSIAYNLTNDKKIWIKFRGYPTGKRLNMNVSNPTIGGISFIYQNSFNNWKNFFWKSNQTTNKLPMNF